jgi:hypothetical protein
MLALEQSVDRVGLKGFGEVVALAELAAKLAQGGQLLGRLDPFGDGLQAEGLAQDDDGPGQGGLLGAAATPATKVRSILRMLTGRRCRQLREE